MQQFNSELQGSCFRNSPLDSPQSSNESQNSNQSSQPNPYKILLERSQADLAQKTQTRQNSETQCQAIQAKLAQLTKQMQSLALEAQ